MTLNPIAALSAFTAKARTILPKGFSTSDQELALTTYDDMSTVANWVQNEKFLNFAGMLVPVPPGFNTYVIDHLQRLESVWDVLQNLLDGILKPVDRQLAQLTHDKGILTLPVGFRVKDFRYPLKNINPEDLTKKLAQSYLPNTVDQRAIEKTFHSALEIETCFSRAQALRDEISKKLRKDVTKLIESISASADILAEYGESIHPQSRENIEQMIDIASNWVELFGLFMKQTNELLETMNGISDRLKALRAGKR